MSIFEILEKREIKPANEFERLVALFHYEWGTFRLKTSLKQIINNVFHKILTQLRQTFLSVDDLLKGIGLSEDYAYWKEWKDLFLYSEMLLNLINYTKEYFEKDDTARETAQQIISNINVILEKNNHEWVQTKEGYIIVDKNPAATEAIECLENDKTDLALNMIEYNRVLLKGNLARKREILVTLADYTEPMNNDFKRSQYAALYNDSRFLVNAIDIRHNNSGKGDLPEKAKAWTPQEKEGWYDKTYQVLLTVILTRKYMDVSKEIQDLKSARN
ncbi:hypothetical protein [Fibrobacter sp.]|uniref:hypothetical protein n=1 Tax=Fibrobacter sp. TaxID=35828 RepID=UPI002610E82D|nr:hypothetical protein [Fibrobacter sp.]MDD5943355.1 hypothetical protein [Fibrobacter sp.]